MDAKINLNASYIKMLAGSKQNIQNDENVIYLIKAMANQDTPASLFEADAQRAESDPTDN